MRGFSRQTLSVLVFVGFLAAFVIYLVTNPSDFARLGNVSPWFMIVLALLHGLTLVTNALFLMAVLRPFDKHLSVGEASFVSLMSAIGNYFTPFRGGAGIRAIYLKRRHRLNYTTFLATLAGNYAITFFINSAVGIIALLLVRDHTTPRTFGWILVFLLTVFFATCWLSVVGVPTFLLRARLRETRWGRLVHILHNVSVGWNRVASERRLVLDLSLVTLANLCIVVLLTYTEARALGFHARFWGLVMYSVLASMSLLVSVTPGSFGIRESIIILGSTAVGFDTEEILAISVIDRAVLFVVLVAGWLLSPLLARIWPAPASTLTDQTSGSEKDGADDEGHR